MKKRIFNNWILKLVSVVCAMVLWFIVYNSEDPVEYGRFYSVPVVFENTEVLEEEGKVYEVLDGTDVIDSIVIEANRSVIDDLSKEDLLVVADFNNMKMDKTIEIEISSEKHPNGEISFKPSESIVKLFVEDEVSKQFDVHIETRGEVAEGYMVGSSSITPNRFSITGGSSIVSKISKAVAIVDISNATNNISTNVAITLYDENGSEIPTDKLEMSMQTVNSTIEVLATKTVPIRYEISGKVAENYVATGEVIYETTELMIAGKEHTLAALSEIVVNGEEMTIEGAQGDATLRVDLEDYLPTGVQRVDKKASRWVEVIVKVVPIIEKEFTLQASQVTIQNIPENCFADPTLETAKFTVIIRGAEHIINEIKVSELKGVIDIAEWMAENSLTKLGEGKVYQIVPEFDLGEELSVIFSGEIDVVAGIVEE